MEFKGCLISWLKALMNIVWYCAVSSSFFFSKNYLTKFVLSSIIRSMAFSFFHSIKTNFASSCNNVFCSLYSTIPRWNVSFKLQFSQKSSEHFSRSWLFSFPPSLSLDSFQIISYSSQLNTFFNLSLQKRISFLLKTTTAYKIFCDNIVH